MTERSVRYDTHRERHLIHGQRGRQGMEALLTNIIKPYFATSYAGHYLHQYPSCAHLSKKIEEKDKLDLIKYLS